MYLSGWIGTDLNYQLALMSVREWPHGMQVPFEVQKSVNSSAKTSHLLSKVHCISADDRHGIDLTDWTFLLVGAVKSCSLTL